jgi:protease IV
MRRRSLLIAAFAAVALVVAFALFSSGVRIPEGSVLVVELGGELPEAPAVDFLDRIGGSGGMALPTLLLQLDKARVDDRIAAVLLQIRPLDVGYARLQELRDALERLRGKRRVIALLDLQSLNATREMYLASAADEIYVVPTFLGPLSGVAGQYLHMGGLLSKIGVVVEYERIGQYKSAPEQLGATQMSGPARAQANEMLDGLYEQIVTGIAKGRGLEAPALRELIDRAPSTGKEYVDAGLANGIAGREEVLARVGLDHAEEIELATYAHVDPQDLGLRNGPRIALIFGEGTILPGKGGFGSREFAADRVEDALEEARDDESVRAIVLRINSGGGSALASDQVWRAVRAAREKKPVVVSMADAAASGGYYIASAANGIVAEPATLTGSIGVFLLRPSLGELFGKLEINSELIKRGKLAGLQAGDAQLTNEERERVRTFVRSLYDEFLTRVSTGRDMKVEDVDQLGQGRVWLGSRALDNKLVDELGGLDTAVAFAMRESGLDPAVDPERVVMPGPRSLGEQMQELLRGEWRDELLGGIVGRPLLDRAQALLALRDGAAYLPLDWIEIH